MDKLLIESAVGCYVYGQGKEYLDFTSGGIFEAPFGAYWQIPQWPLIAMYNAHYDNGPALRLQDMLREWTGFESVVLFSTGSEAAEAYWRCMRIYTGKPNVWGGLVDPDDCGKEQAPPDAMHGVTLGSLIMAGRMTWPPLDPTGAFMGRYAQSADGTACAIWEPYHAPSAQFHKEKTIDRLKLMINTYPNIPHCSDEVQSGIGRTGRLLAYTWYDGLKPEFVILGKMLGGGLPLSALLGPKEILEDELVIENAHLHSTHSGNPFICNVGCTVIERIQNEDLIERSMEMGAVLDRELANIPVRHHSGRGLLAGLEMEGPLQASKVVLKCREKGLLVVDTGRKWVKLGPALIIAEEEIVKGCAILKEAVEEVQHADSEAQRDFGEESGYSSEDVHGHRLEDEGPSPDVHSAEDGGQ